jgi:hypothetical protein
MGQGSPLTYPNVTDANTLPDTSPVARIHKLQWRNGIRIWKYLYTTDDLHHNLIPTTAPPRRNANEHFVSLASINVRD